jgi:apolipoprotein N-acyltransferase
VPSPRDERSSRYLLGLVLGGAAAFHLAFISPWLSCLIPLYLLCVIELSRARTGRIAFRCGLLLGLLVFIPKVFFFYTIFQRAAVALWFILALWHGVFAYLAFWARRNTTPLLSALLIPIFWTGLEYFRSELYYLKFSWVSPGFAFAAEPSILIPLLGVYGVSFVIALGVSFFLSFPGTVRRLAAIALIALMVISALPLRDLSAKPTRFLNVAGMQLEFPVELEVPQKLDQLVKAHPEAQVLVLSEYTFDGPLPDRIRKWCKTNSKYLIVGAKDPVGDNFYNTAFVIGPTGDVVFKQVKAVPIPFFKDGLPAPEQRPWDSPWGKIGICICYDLSFTRVVDRLVSQGAKILIVPMMDVAEWGSQQHAMHARIPPARAAEYRIPIFRIASSGISQYVTPDGKVSASASFPGQEEILSAQLPLDTHPTLPLDRALGPFFAAVSGVALLASFFMRQPKPVSSEEQLNSHPESLSTNQ